MDPNIASALQILGGSAVVAAVVSGVISFWREHEAEKRAVRREEAAERRAEARERQREERDLRLQQIDETQADYLGSMAWLMYRSMGFQEHMTSTRWGPEHFPHAQWYLLGHDTLIENVMDFRIELSARAQGAGFTEEDASRMGALQGQMMALLELQRERARSGQQPVWPSAAAVQRLVRKFGELHGIPPEYMPKINLDSE